jgi:hypothetical protein
MADPLTIAIWSGGGLHRFNHVHSVSGRLSQGVALWAKSAGADLTASQWAEAHV